MTLRLIREPSVDGATLGVLFVDDVFFSFALEDEIREVPGAAVATWKRHGRTAIPAGRYRVTLRYSPRFAKTTPWLHDVPGFEWILIHAGNREADTEGCILVGLDRGQAFVGRSQMAFQRLMLKLATAADDVWISVENPPSYAAKVAA